MLSIPDSKNDSTEIQNYKQSVLRKEHCFYCFHVIDRHLDNQGHLDSDWSHLFKQYQKEYPLFVSWHLTLSSKQHLRGCIGTFTPKSLEQGLLEYSKLSAFHDRRFKPITRSEFHRLKCSISLLTNFEPLTDGNFLNWQPGLHGITLTIQRKVKKLIPAGIGRELGKESYSATFLPQVAVEQGWNRIQTFEALLAKSGFKPLHKDGTVNQSESHRTIAKFIAGQGGSKGDQFREVFDIQVTRYTSETVEATHKEYESHRIGTL